MIEGICRLCHEKRRLCHSHIVPEWCYERLYDGQHRIAVVGPKGQHPPHLKKGRREFLLCKRCEGYLNTLYEQPFRTYWRTAVPRQPCPENATQVTLCGFNYRVFKLFHLSILWRLGVCGLPEMTISLGPYEEKIRKMLLLKDPGPADHYPILGRVLFSGNGCVADGLITSALEGRIDGSRVYMICYCGVEWLFVLTDHPTPTQTKLAHAAPQPDGNMILLAGGLGKSRSITEILKYADFDS